MTNKNKIYIRKGKTQALGLIPYHKNAPLKRILLQDDSTFPDIKRILPGSNYHIATHIISKLPKKVPEYVDFHAHNCDEINIILSENGKLTYEISTEDKNYIISSPAIIYIPKRTRHKMRAIKGKGIYLCIIMSKNYKKSLIKEK
ncbi:MAG: 2-isopropylmalate synthase [Candidatus Nanoarchaeia archaeon]|nr:2-isopropylmalate synthase [Candidatus Nanoarchaeia archaeon]MDD5740636.1 2-isopropylmalate synthase [Candidatus Nanoarchaeia archaeon]